ncbi:MAG: Flp family type IVb pilin [Actinomycetota bacterium]
MWLQTMYVRVTEALRREEGQGLVEYALILALVSVISIGVLTIVGTDVQAVLQDVADALPTPA